MLNINSIMFTDGNTKEYDYAPDGRKLSATYKYAADGIVVPLDRDIKLIVVG